MEELNSQSSFDRSLDITTNPPEGLPDGLYTYPGIDALYKKENGQWLKKVGGSNYIQLKDGNVAERIKKLESDAIPVPQKKEEIQKFTNIQDFDVIQPVEQYTDIFERKENLLVKPKKEEKPKDIRIVDNDGIKTWQEQKEVKVQQKIDPKTGIPMGASYFTKYEDITDPTRVSKLNESYNEDASTSKDQKVFTGYPGQQGTEYILNEDNLWEVKRPGSDDFLIVSTPESVTALNNYFKQNAEIFDDKKATEIKNKNKETLDLRYRINKLDKKLIAGTEENAQEVLERLFPEYEFEQFGFGTDNIRVKSKSNEITLSLDNWTNESDESELLRLRSFLRENVGDIDESRYKAVMLQRKLDAQNKRYYGTFGFSSLQTVLETGKPKELGLEEKTEAAREEFLIDLSSQYKDAYLRTKDKSEKEKNAAFSVLKPKEEEISIINKYADDVLAQGNILIKQKKQVDTDISILESNYKNGLINEDEYNQSITGINDKLKSINNESKSFQNNLKNVSLSQDLVNKSIAANILIQKNKGSFVGGIAYSAVDGILSIPRMVAMADKETKDKWIEEIVGVGTTESYVNSDDRWDITKAAFQMSRSLSAMAVGSIGGTYGAYASLYAMSYYEMKDELDQLDISGVSEGDKVLMSAAYGLIGGALENFGLSYLVGKSPLKSALSNSILKNVFSQIPKNASKEMVEAQVMKSTKMMIAKYGITAAGSSVLEGGVEGTQKLAQMGIQEVYDVMKGSDYFNNKSAYEVLGDVAYESYMGFLGGGIVETVQQSGNVLKDGSAAFKDKKQLNLLIDAAKTMGIDKALVSKLKSDILNGNIKKEEAEKQLNAFKEMQGKIKSIPDDMSVDNQAKALDLILERDRLNKEIEGKDPNLVKPQSDRITEINNSLQELSKQNAVQEPSTEGVLQREQEGVTETGGERGGMEQVVQGEEVTREDKTKAVQEEVVPGATAKVADVDIVYPTQPQAEERKAFRSTSEYVENASKELQVEDVEALSKELNGEFGLLTAENPMAQPLTEEENKQLNQKAEEWLTSRGYTPRRVTGKYGQAENSFFVPNLTRQDAIEFAKQFNQEAVAHSDGLVYQDGSMNPRVKENDNLSFTESYSPESDFVSVVNTKDGLKTFSIGYNFDEKVMPEQQPVTQIEEVTITPETSQTVTDRINKETDTKRKKVFTAVQKVLSAIPNSRIILHDNTDAFVAGVAKSANITNDEAISQGVQDNRGSYVNGDIHINLEKAGVSTVFHEAFHDLLAKKGLESGALLEMAKGLKSVISDKGLKDRLDKFVSNYEQGERAEEYTTELGAIMAEAQKELSTTKFQQFKTLVNKIAKKLGMPVVFSAASTAQDAVDFMNSVSGKLGRGEQIEDINSIVTDGIQLNVVNPTGIKKQVEVKDNYKLSFVKKEDIINIEELIKNISERGQKVWFWMADQLGRGYVFDEVSGEKHYLDAGPSFALDPKNRSKRIIWASGKTVEDLKNSIDSSDYIFLVSGNPQTAKLFNKAVFDLYVKKLGNYNSFKKEVLSNNPRKGISEVLNAHDSWETLREDSSTDDAKKGKIGTGRKKFLNQINDAVNKPNSTLGKMLKNKNAIIDINSIRDDFYAENGFEQNDIMLVLKAEKVGSKSEHSTYENDLIGDVVGVPDKKINAYDILSDEDKSRYKDMSNSDRNKQQSVTAPYGSGVRKIKAQKITTSDINKILRNNPELISELRNAILKVNREWVMISGEKWNKSELINLVKNKIGSEVDKIVDIKIIGSMVYGTNKSNSDLDLLVEYEGDIREDDLFSFANDDKIYINGVKVDINPIKQSKTGNIKDQEADEIKYINEIANAKYIAKAYNSVIETGANPELVKIVDNAIQKQFNIKAQKVLPESVEKRLTEDGKGNYVFHHYSRQNRDTIKPTTGDGSFIVSKDEASALASVNGVAQYYAMADQKEQGTGNVQHTVLVPMDEVYYLQEDKLNLYDKAKEEFQKARPGQAFNPNYQAAWIGKVANDMGYKMLVSEWRNGELRAQTTLELKPEAENIEMKPRENITFNVGDKVNVFGEDAVITEVNGDIVSYKGDRSSGSLNVVRSKQSIKKISSIKAQKQSKEDAIQDAKDIHEKSFKRFKDSKRAIANAVNNLEKSDWYRDSNDTQREEAIREIKKFFGEKLKAAPSVAKVMGKTKQTAFVSDLAAAIRDQVKLQARSSRETAKDINDRRKALGESIKQVVKSYKGKITEKQLNAINRRIASVNLFNQEMVERVVDYVNKVMSNADYAGKVNNAFAERRAIRRMMKSGNMTETVAVAREFVQIDPSMVDDIDTYLEMAAQIRGAVKSSKRAKESVSLKQIVNFGEAYEYIKPTLERQEEMMKNMRLAEYNDLVDSGVISKDMTLKVINNIIDTIRINESAKIKENDEAAAMEFLKDKLGYIKTLLRISPLKGYNPVTGEQIEISERHSNMINNIIKSNLDDLSLKQMIEMVDSLNNFYENGAVGGLEAAYETILGEQNAKSLEKKGVVARSLKLYFNKNLGQIASTEITSLTELFNRMFVGVERGIEVMTKSGFADIVLGANKARKMVKEIQDRYVKEFGKTKDFFQIENVYERGAFAFLSRNLIGNDAEVKSEFNRRVDLLLESVEALKNGTAKEQEMAKIYEKVLDKMDVKSRDLNTIAGKMESFNQEATQWWINEWSKHYSDLSDVSRSVYNTILGKDINYTPDRYKSTTEGSKLGIDDNIVERNSAFLINTDSITDTNESGVMIASVRPKVLPKGRYVSLDFDMNNVDSLTGALVDINTAGAIRRLDSFFKSKSFKAIVPTIEDRKILTERVNKYIRRSKNKLSVPSDVFRNIDNALNTVSSVGTALGLGGVLQSVKQTVSVAISTAIQTGTSFNIYAGEEFNNWLNTTGASVTNRGQESLTAIESTNKKLKSFNGTFDKAIDTYKNLTQWQLKLFLSRPDVFVARAAFKSYYEQYLKSKGYDVSKINWSTWNETIKKEGLKELNDAAIIYADTMVSRQQNVSDERLAGELLASEDSARKLIRKALLPFASFSINQRARLVADINALFLNWNNISPEDKAIAIKSIAGTTAEQGVFQMINFGIGMALYWVAQSMAGHDDDDEEWKKRMNNATKYPLRSLLADMASPNPLADDAVIFGADQLLAMFGSPSEGEIKQAIKDEEALREFLGKDPMNESQINKFKEQYIKDNTYQLAYNFTNSEEGKYGMFSIAADQYLKLAENSEMATNGTFTDDYMGKQTTKYLTDKDKSLAKSVFYGLEVPYTTGAALKEMGQVANKTYSIIKKRALTEQQYETYKEFKKEFKREPQEWEIKMIKSTKSQDKLIDEVYFIQDQGGLSQKQGLEYLKVFNKIGPLIPEDYRLIVEGKSADYIIKKALK